MSINDNILQLPTKRHTRRQLSIKYLIHIIIIGMLIILPEILTTTDKPFQSVPMLKLGIYVKALIFIAVFYINYYLIISKNLQRKWFVGRLIGYNVLTVAVSLTLFWLISNWMQPYWDEAWRIQQSSPGLSGPPHPLHRHHGQDWGHILSIFSRDFMMLILTIALSLAMRLSDTWLNLSRRAEQLTAARRQQELQHLKSQLNPHFLFNTLNSIYALIAISPTKAQNAVHELSSLLRYVLYDNSDEVEVQRELKFIESYVQLMALRLSPSTTLETYFDIGNMGHYKVAPLLFIPLVENTFKHCNLGSQGARISIDGRIIDNKVIFKTANTCQPNQKTDEIITNQNSSKDQTEKSGGIGLVNLRRRLLLIYGNKASITTNLTDNVFSTELIIPLQSEKL